MGRVKSPAFRDTGNRPIVTESRCPHCGGALPWDADGDLSYVCSCGLDWGNSAPFPKAHLDRAEWSAVRNMLILRCGGRCEVTGAPLRAGRWSAHHRRARGMGGTDRPNTNSLANLLAVTGDGTTGVHGWIESNRNTARALGWLIDRENNLEPDDVPVVLYGGRRVLLLPCVGAYLPAPGDPYHLGPLPVITP
jgi:hypothetical protein